MAYPQVYDQEYASCMGWGSISSTDCGAYADCVATSAVATGQYLLANCSQGICESFTGPIVIQPGVEYNCWQANIPPTPPPPSIPSLPTQVPPCDIYRDCKMQPGSSCILI